MHAAVCGSALRALGNEPRRRPPCGRGGRPAHVRRFGSVSAFPVDPEVPGDAAELGFCRGKDPGRSRLCDSGGDWGYH